MNVKDTSVVWLPVNDVDRAVAFYRDRLGLQEVRSESEWAELDAGGLRIGLNAHERPGGGGGAVIAFEPRDGIDGAVAELREAGVEVAGEPSEHPWGRVATLKDPDGNDVQLYEPPGN